MKASAISDPSPTFVDAGQMGWIEGFFSFETGAIESRGATFGWSSRPMASTGRGRF
ncbi:hypothetical protein [Aeromicrobium sp. UC242_57]|uniref:hypothetical protein n=1 Tax=Aeromicrobium sp. UC242_57 TaxID=3374624 RepID=UPI0037A42012